jgi:uncharacterized membrane protein YphA (DoxX/SURF4 family)
VSVTEQLFRFFQLHGSAYHLAIARITIGLCSYAVVWEAWRFLPRILSPLVVQLPYFTWLPRLPSSALPLFMFVWFIAASALVVGYKTRLAGAIITCLSAYTLLLDEQTYSNHLYLFFLIALLLTVADSGAALSLDARSKGARESVPGWPIVLLRFQVSLVYGFSAIAKLTPQFLSGDVLFQTLKQQGWVSFPHSLRTPQLITALAMSAIILELFIAVGLWSKRLRWGAVIAGVTLHVFILVMLDSSRLSLGIFALEMFAVYPLFFQRLERAVV